MSRDTTASVSATRLAERFLSVSRLIGKSSTRAKFGPLSNARYELLHHLFHEGSQPMGAMARRLGVAARTVTDLVDGLEADGYVRRVDHTTDRRTVILELTHDGLAVLKLARRARLTHVARLFEALEPEERAVLDQLLNKVTNPSDAGPPDISHGPL